MPLKIKCIAQLVLQPLLLQPFFNFPEPRSAINRRFFIRLDLTNLHRRGKTRW